MDLSKRVSPMSNEGRNLYVINRITEVFLELLNEKSIGDISISEVCNLSGVSRASFYRNYETKEDVLKKYLKTLWIAYEDELKQSVNTYHFYEMILRYFYSHKELSLLLYRQGTEGLLYEMIRWGARIDEAQNCAERYVRSTAAGLIFGIIDEWMRQGMKDTPEEILEVLQDSWFSL